MQQYLKNDLLYLLRILESTEKAMLFPGLLIILLTLPSRQLKQLKTEIEKEDKSNKSAGLEALLLNGPTVTKKQLDTIAKNRKAINQWRTKLFWLTHLFLLNITGKLTNRNPYG